MLKNGKPKLYFGNERIAKMLHNNANSEYHEILKLPCGKCIGCRMKRAAEWAVRCIHESRYYDATCFITLTYDTPHLPPRQTLVKKDFQDFMKRLRAHLDYQHDIEEIRYFMAGEYGESKGRPHYHAIIFGYDFPDKTPCEKNPWSESPLYESEELTKLWGMGRCTIGTLTHQSAAYVAAYTTKKVYGKDMEKEYAAQGKIPPYNAMSQGIGRRWFTAFKGDIYPCDYLIHPETKIRMAVPRFYDKLLAEYSLEEYEAVKQKREQKRSRSVNPENDSPERLAVREECHKLRIARLKRRIERGDDSLK